MGAERIGFHKRHPDVHILTPGEKTDLLVDHAIDVAARVYRDICKARGVDELTLPIPLLDILTLYDDVYPLIRPIKGLWYVNSDGTKACLFGRAIPPECDGGLKDTDQWVIELDTTFPSYESQRFTTAHEFGHVVFGVVAPNVGGVTYEIGELYADTFAKHLLAPDCLLEPWLEGQKSRHLPYLIRSGSEMFGMPPTDFGDRIMTLLHAAWLENPRNKLRR